jgi:hypothetical protein
MDPTDLVLRAIGAFYVFAGYMGTRAVLTSCILDQAIAAIAAEKPSAAERAQNLWLLCASLVILAGGALLLLLVDLAAWMFAAAALGQAAYIYVVAPRWFDAAEPPDAQGRRQSTNAFVVYGAATLFVIWAAVTGRLLGWREVPWPILAAVATVIAGYAVHTLWSFAKPLRPGRPGSEA